MSTDAIKLIYSIGNLSVLLT